MGCGDRGGDGSRVVAGTRVPVSRGRVVLIVVFVATLCFVWGHSLMSRDASSQESTWVMNLVAPFLEIFVGTGNVTHHMVRKLAHFCEFTAVGVELALLLRVGLGAGLGAGPRAGLGAGLGVGPRTGGSGAGCLAEEGAACAAASAGEELPARTPILGLSTRLPLRAMLACNFGLLIAFMDETIQLFSDRGSQVQDVWLDFAGVVTGVLLAVAVRRIVGWLRARRAARA